MHGSFYLVLVCSILGNNKSVLLKLPKETMQAEEEEGELALGKRHHKKRALKLGLQLVRFLATGLRGRRGWEEYLKCPWVQQVRIRI